jgi:hypothetical protein
LRQSAVVVLFFSSVGKSFDGYWIWFVWLKFLCFKSFPPETTNLYLSFGRSITEILMHSWWCVMAGKGNWWEWEGTKVAFIYVLIFIFESKSVEYRSKFS